MNQRSIIAIGAIIVLVGISFLVFRSSPIQKPSATPAPSPTPTPVTLLNYVDSDDAQARLTIDGRIVAKEKHYSVTLAVAKQHRDLNVFQGYTATPVQSNGLDNNQPAFEDFIRALHNAGFDSNTKNPKAASTAIGLCPQGQRYTYELIQGGRIILSSWSTTCSDPTNFTGNAASIRNLFHLQFPEYQSIVGKIQL